MSSLLKKISTTLISSSARASDLIFLPLSSLLLLFTVKSHDSRTALCFLGDSAWTTWERNWDFFLSCFGRLYYTDSCLLFQGFEDSWISRVSSLFLRFRNRFLAAWTLFFSHSFSLNLDFSISDMVLFLSAYFFFFLSLSFFLYSSCLLGSLQIFFLHFLLLSVLEAIFLAELTVHLGNHFEFRHMVLPSHDTLLDSST